MVSGWLNFSKVEYSLGKVKNHSKTSTHNLNIFLFKTQRFIHQPIFKTKASSLNAGPQLNVPDHLSYINYNMLNCPMISSFILSKIEQEHKDTNNTSRMLLDSYYFSQSFTAGLPILNSMAIFYEPNLFFQVSSQTTVIVFKPTTLFLNSVFISLQDT